LQQEEIYFRPTYKKNGTVHHASDELDVVHLIEKGASFVSRFKFILLGFALAGLIGGLYFYFTSPKQYTTRLILRSLILTNQEEIEVIGNWKALLCKDGRNELAGIMNSPGEVINSLSNISAEEIQKLYVQNNPNGFIVNVVVTDTSVLNQLQNGILYGLNNSPYVKEKLITRRAKYNQLIENVKNEIAKLTITKDAVDKLVISRTSTPIFVDISRINAQWIELNEKLMSYQEELKFLSGVQLLEGFDKGKPASSWLRPVFFGLATGCFLGYLLSLVLYVRSKIKASQKAVAAG
jgi:tetrahydromethanopterin S-methyltransferase subunit B